MFSNSYLYATLGKSAVTTSLPFGNYRQEHVIQGCPLQKEIQIDSMCEICLVLTPHKQHITFGGLNGIFACCLFIFSACQSMLDNLTPSSWFLTRLDLQSWIARAAEQGSAGGGESGVHLSYSGILHSRSPSHISSSYLLKIACAFNQRRNLRVKSAQSLLVNSNLWSNSKIFCLNCSLNLSFALNGTSHKIK